MLKYNLLAMLKKLFKLFLNQIMYKLILLTLIFLSCSNNLLNKKVEKENLLFNWVKNPRILCTQNQICGLGEAKTLEGAKSNARDEIAKTFSVQVNSSSRYSQNYHSNSKINSSVSSKENQFSENIERDINEITDQVLEGVEILKTGKYDENYFVLMQLNRKLANRILNSNLAEIENIAKRKLSKNYRGSLLEAKLLKSSWLELVKRWEIINDKKYLKTIFKKIENALELKFLSKTKVYLNNKKKNKVLISQLNEFGYEVTNSKERASIFVDLEIISKKVHLNVEGFYKSKLSLNLKFYFRFKNKKRSNISKEAQKSWFIVARSKKQLNIEGNEQIKKYFNNNIFNLLID